MVAVGVGKGQTEDDSGDRTAKGRWDWVGAEGEEVSRVTRKGQLWEMGLKVGPL